VLFGSAQGDRQAVIELATLKNTLREFGWTEGRNILIEAGWAASDVARIQGFARELVSLQPDLIVAHTTPVVAALQRETKTIPIVFVVVADPVGSGFLEFCPDRPDVLGSQRRLCPGKLAFIPRHSLGRCGRIRLILHGRTPRSVAENEKNDHRMRAPN
jgi:hypothetical protein